MRTAIVYVSKHHGNTLKVAKILGWELNAQMIKINEFDPSKAGAYDMIGFGSGIYFRGIDKKMFMMLDHFPIMKGKLAFIFSTAGTPSLSYHKGFKHKLQRKGFEVIDEFTCRGIETNKLFGLFGAKNKGHPTEEDLDHARKFAKNIRDMYYD